MVVTNNHKKRLRHSHKQILKKNLKFSKKRRRKRGRSNLCKIWKRSKKPKLMAV